MVLSIILIGFIHVNTAPSYYKTIELLQFVINIEIVLSLVGNILVNETYFFYQKANWFSTLHGVVTILDNVFIILTIRNDDYRQIADLFRALRLLRFFIILKITSTTFLYQIHKIKSTFLIALNKILMIFVWIFIISAAYSLAFLYYFQDNALPNFTNFGTSLLMMMDYTNG